jgi:hypothetical protein
MSIHQILLFYLNLGHALRNHNLVKLMVLFFTNDFILDCIFRLHLLVFYLTIYLMIITEVHQLRIYIKVGEQLRIMNGL